MTVEERLKMIIGDLVISRVALETRIEELQAELQKLQGPKEADPPSMFKQAAE
jgi:hypothetical protein